MKIKNRTERLFNSSKINTKKTLRSAVEAEIKVILIEPNLLHDIILPKLFVF